MLVFAVVLAVAAQADPADADGPPPPLTAPAPAPAASTSTARARIKRVNGAMVSPSARLWPKDDVVVSADDTSGGDDLEYAWTLVAKPARSTVRIDRPDEVDTGFVYIDADDGRAYAGLDEAGEYRVHLKVTSSSSSSGTSVAERDIVLHVGWPVMRNLITSPTAQRVITAAAPPADRVSPELRSSMTTGSLAGCAVGTCVPCGLGTLGVLAPGVGTLAFGCGLAACGPCGTAGALAGAGFGANDAALDLMSLSPWLLTGALCEVVGGSLIGTAALFSGAFASFGIGGVNPATGAPAPVFGVTPDPSLVTLGVIGGGVLVVAGGPVTVLSAWASAPGEADAAPAASFRSLARGSDDGTR